MADVATPLGPLGPQDLANSVTAFCTMLGGLVPLLLCRFVRPQSARWHLAYLSIFVTGLPTLGWHGWGGHVWHVLDVGTNLLVAWSIQFAVLGDFYPSRVSRRVAAASGALNLLMVAVMLWEAATDSRVLAVTFGGFGGFFPGELVLVADAVGVVVLLFLARDRIGPRAAPLLRVVSATFLLGLGLATAHGDTLHARVLSWHALWHIVGAFGFVLLWAYNHVRIEEESAPASA